MKTMKRFSIICVIGLALMSPCLADNTIQWGTQGVQVFDNLGTTPLVGSWNEADGGYLVQLIYAGDNAAIDPVDVADMDVYGVSGDDQFIAYAWIGRGQNPSTRQGQFKGADLTETAKARTQYYIRAWQGVSSSVGTGYMPSDSSTYYGNSALYTFQDEPAPANEFYIGSSFSTTLQAVPEPATVALALAGLGLLVFRRFRKKS